MIHCHIFAHSETKNGMAGIVTFFEVYPASKVSAPAVHGAGHVAGEREL